MNTWQFIYDKVNAQIIVILLYVLHSEGSSPGRQGFKMVIAADGSFFGSIGGGIMEHKFVELAKTILNENEGAAGLYRQVHDKEAGKNKSGMICSGEQTIFLYPVQVKDIDYIHSLITSIRENKNGLLQLTPSGILFLNETPDANFYFKQHSETDFILIEKTGYKNVLHIIGGGHCSLAFSKLMHSMDFYIKVYDERKELNTMEQNEFAHEKIILSSYADLKDFIKDGDNVYVAIMTFGYRTDFTALEALLNKHFKYIGLLGSKKKIEKLFADYKERNLDPSWLQQVYSPIGVNIKSQTPEEIAISIAAEIISVKNKDQ